MARRKAVSQLFFCLTLLLSCVPVALSQEPPEPLQTALALKAIGGDQAAFRQLVALGNAGDAEAQYSLGLMYANGEGMPKDFARAVSWFESCRATAR